MQGHTGTHEPPHFMYERDKQLSVTIAVPRCGPFEPCQLLGAIAFCTTGGHYMCTSPDNVEHIELAKYKRIPGSVDEFKSLGLRVRNYCVEIARVKE